MWKLGVSAHVAVQFSVIHDGGHAALPSLSWVGENLSGEWGDQECYTFRRASLLKMVVNDSFQKENFYFKIKLFGSDCTVKSLGNLKAGKRTRDSWYLLVTVWLPARFQFWMCAVSWLILWFVPLSSHFPIAGLPEVSCTCWERPQILMVSPKDLLHRVFSHCHDPWSPLVAWRPASRLPELHLHSLVLLVESLKSSSMSYLWGNWS